MTIRRLRSKGRLSAAVRVLIIAGMAAGTMGQACAPPPVVPPANSSPTANAGADRTVNVNSAVTLSGAGSSDPDGDTLSFSWTQTAGTNVTLAGANTDTVSFVAPSTAEALSFQLSVDDGNGGTDTDSVNVLVTENVVATTPTLFIANFGGDSVVGYDITNPNAVNGNLAPDANLQGAQTLLDNPSDIIVDAGGALLASNFTTPSVTGYDNASDLSGVNGNVAPSRNVQGAATLLTQPISLAVNTSNDLAFVADLVTDDIYVYANASTAAFNGNLAPTRTIQSADINNPLGINFGANDELYVANDGNNNVLVFANASNLNGNVQPSRIIQSNSFTVNQLFDVFIDGNDTMFVVDSGGFIYTFNNASILNGTVAPDFTLQVPPANQITAIAVDTAGNGYIVDVGNDAMYGYNNIATLNGAVNPNRTLQGANTQLNQPIRVFLLE